MVLESKFCNKNGHRKSNAADERNAENLFEVQSTGQAAQAQPDGNPCESRDTDQFPADQSGNDPKRNRDSSCIVDRQDCGNFLSLNSRHPERVIEVDWGESEHTSYPVELTLYAYDRQGLLRDISNVLADEEVSVLALQTKTDKKKMQAVMDGDIATTTIAKHLKFKDSDALCIALGAADLSSAAIATALQNLRRDDSVEIRSAASKPRLAQPATGLSGRATKPQQSQGLVQTAGQGTKSAARPGNS